MDKAMDLVISTQMPMKQIGQLVGFSDYSYFCRIFRQHCGTAPLPAAFVRVVEADSRNQRRAVNRYSTFSGPSGRQPGRGSSSNPAWAK